MLMRLSRSVTNQGDELGEEKSLLARTLTRTGCVKKKSDAGGGRRVLILHFSDTCVLPFKSK